MKFFSQPNSGIIVIDGKITTEHQFRNSVLKSINDLQSQKKIKKISNSKSQTSLRISMLILKYTKMTEAIDLDNVNKADVLSIVLGYDAENIRRFLSNPFIGLSNNKTKRDILTSVINYLQNKNLIEAATWARKDMLRLATEKNN